MTPVAQDASETVDTCSCTTCDSFTCFGNRQKNSPCSCEKCKTSESCPLYGIKITPDKTAAETNIVQDVTKPANDIELSKEIEKIKSAVKQAIKDSISNNMDVKRPELSKIESLKIDKRLYLNVDKNPSIRSEVIKSRYEERIKVKVSTEKPPSQIRSTAARHSDNDMESTRIKLSSELMNVNVNDLKQYLSFNKPIINSDTSFNKYNDTSSYKISKFNIFDKIKEVYDACSCKVCECLTSNRNANCRCKPCDCIDCMSFLQSDLNYSGSGFFGNYKSILTELNKTENTCQCQPCDCIKCSDITQTCDCQPCQCAECRTSGQKPKMHLVVAPVGEEPRRVLCQCSPCECIECVQRFGMSSVGHEMSTGTNRHLNCQCEMCNNDACETDGANICPCERRNKIVNKPVQRDTNDYDIRTVLYE